MFESMDLSSLLPGRSSSSGGNYTELSSGDEQQQQQQQEEEGWFPSLTWRERLLGCATCMIGGYILSFGSLFRLKHLIMGNPMPYVINATVGNMIALCGSCFLSGPRQQSRKMFHPKRKIATMLYLGSMALTILIAVIPFPGTKAPVLLFLMLCQDVAITWYCLSYIPFAREAIIGWWHHYISGDD